MTFYQKVQIKQKQKFNLIFSNFNFTKLYLIVLYVYSIYIPCGSIYLEILYIYINFT